MILCLIFTFIHIAFAQLVWYNHFKGCDIMDIYNTVNQMRINHQTIFDLNIRVTYYVRVSTLKEEQDTSVDNQIAHFEKLIEENPNWTYVQ